MMKAIIIDDEPLARSIVKEYLAFYTDIELVAECSNGFEGLKAIQEHQPDLLFLDIQMPKITGFEMLELLDPLPSVIFTTAFDEYALKAFEAHAIDYLLKPFSKDRFDKAMQKWMQQRQNANTPAQITNAINEISTRQPEEKHRIVVKNGSNIQIIPAQDVLYIEAYDDYVKIHTKTGYHLKKKTMGYYEQVLDASQFVRVHRSYLLQVNELTRIEPLEKDAHIALLRNGVKIPLSKSGYIKLKEVLGI